MFPLKNDKSPAVKDWKNYTGSASSPMIGIMIPKGVIVIDLDLYKGVTTQSVDRALGCSLDWSGAELQRTRSGGMHYAFVCDGDARQGVDLLGVKGFDTRCAGKGYIATGEGYENLTFFDDVNEAITVYADTFPTFPADALQALRGGSVEFDDLNLPGDTDDADGLLEAVSSQPLDNLTVDDVQMYLRALPDSAAEDQDTWLRVGMAIKHQLGDDGWALFDEFSQRCAEKYDSDANRSRWSSFDSNKAGQVTFASVIKMAGGAKIKAIEDIKSLKEQITNAESESALGDLLSTIARMNIDKLELGTIYKVLQAQYKALSGDKPSLSTLKAAIKSKRSKSTADGAFVDDYVFLISANEWMRRDNKICMKSLAFDVENSRLTPLNGDGERQSATSYAMDRVECVDRAMYFPSAGEIFQHSGVCYINTYTPPDVEMIDVGSSDVVPRIMSHVKHLLTDEREQRIFIDYLAHNVQNPGKKLNWSIILQGVQGDGKSLFAEMMQGVMGYENVRVMAVDTLESSFTGWATGQCMTFIEELKLDNLRKYEVLNKLKMYVSNPTVEEHKKGKDPVTVVNTTNYIALTNFKDAIPIDASDRRYCVLFSQWQRKAELEAFMNANPNYYPDLYEVMRENIGELRSWLMNWTVSDEFLKTTRAPETSAKLQMTELSKSDGMIALEDAISQFSDQITLECGAIDVTQLQKIVRRELDFDVSGDSHLSAFPERTALKNCLLNMGYELLGRRRTIFSSGDNKHTLYKI